LRSATTRAAQHHTRVLMIPRAHLLRLCEAYPQLGYRLMRNLATDIAFKLRGSGLRLRQELLSGVHPKTGV
jgi:CRP-like cAMP-binding protein